MLRKASLVALALLAAPVTSAGAGAPPGAEAGSLVFGPYYAPAYHRYHHHHVTYFGPAFDIYVVPAPVYFQPGPGYLKPAPVYLQPVPLNVQPIPSPGYAPPAPAEPPAPALPAPVPNAPPGG